MFYGHTGAVRCGRFTPDGKTIVTGGGEGDATLKVWDPKTGTCTGTIQGHGFHTAGSCAYIVGSPIVLAAASTLLLLWGAMCTYASTAQIDRKSLDLP